MRPRLLFAPFLFLTALLAACASSPPVPETDGSVVRFEAEEDAVRAVYEVPAPLAVARAVLIAFDDHAGFRPTMLESRVLEVEGARGRVEFRLAGLLGIDPQIVCRFEVEDGADRFVLRYEKIGGSMLVTEFRGAFDLRAIPGGRTGITQDLRMRATFLGQDTLVERFREDVLAVRDRFRKAAEDR